MGEVRMSLMESGDIPGAAAVLARAMVDNPLHRAVFGDPAPARQKQIQSMFLELFNNLPATTLIARDGENLVGVMRMKPGTGPETGDAPSGEEPKTDQEYRQRIWFREWDLRDPDEPHWHLGPIGVLPTHRRRGIGAMLMEVFCREVDRTGVMAYLETDLDDNVRFYRKFGFDVVETSDIFGVENRYMVRPRLV